MGWYGLVLLMGLAVPGAGEDCAPPQEKDKQDPHCSYGVDHYYPEVAPYAVPFVPGHYVGYYVGGGCVCGGCDRGPLQGTFGMDYAGHGWIYRHIILKWWPERYQGGIGAYYNEVHVPNVFNIKLRHSSDEHADP